jgi:ABC-2 type transport system ATP-binding protein
MDAQNIASVLVAGGVPFSEIGQHRASLEEVYLDVTRDYATFTAALDDEAMWP